MRILRLEFQNLHSLRGKHVIDFREAPFAGAGIFAITGPTGAGKSTILDAITLAFFGRAARYASGQPRDVMTRHTGECFAEAHFEARDGIFGARWELRRARGKPEGEFQPAKRFVYHLPSHEPLQTKTRALDEWIEDQIGLDYPRFLRSALLAQGEFAAFLKASEKDRAHLLESLTGMGVYAELSRLAHETTRDKRVALETRRAAFGQISLMTPEEREAATKARAEAVAVQKTRALQVEKLRRLLHWRQRQRAHQREVEERRLAAERWTRERSAKSDDLAALARHRRALPLAPSIHAWRAERERTEALTRQTRELQREITERQEAITKEKAEWELARANHGQAETALTTLRTVTAQVIPIDARLRLLRETRDSLAKDLAERQSGRDRAAASLRERGADRARILTRQTEIEQWLREREVDAGLAAALPRWRAELDQLHRLEAEARRAKEGREDLTRRREKLREAAAAAERERRVLATERESLRSAVSAGEARCRERLENQSRAAWEERRAATTASLAEAQERLRRAERSEAALAKAKTLEAQQLAEEQEARNLAETLARAEAEQGRIEANLNVRRRRDEVRRLRAGLRDQEPCPVCGAIEHPLLQPDDDGAEESLAEAESALARVQSAADRARAQVAGLRERRRLRQAELEVCRQEAEENRVPDALLSLRDRIERNERDLTEWTSRLAEHDRERERLDTLALRLREVEDLVGHLDRRLAADQGQATEMEERQAAGSAVLEQATRAAEESRRALANSLARFGEVDPDEDALDRLRSRWLEYEGRLAERVQVAEARGVLDRDIQLAEAEAATLAKTIHDLTARLTEATSARDTASAERTSLFGDREPAAELARAEREVRQLREAMENLARRHEESRSALLALQTRADECRRRAEETAKSIAALEDELGKAMAAANFDSLADLAVSLLTTEIARTLEETERDLNDRWVALEANRERLERQERELTREERALAWEGAPNEETTLAALLGEEEAALAAAQEAEWERRRRLEEDDRARERQGREAKELAESERDLARWERLSGLIGSADGARFSRFAQSLTLRRLLGLANAQLDRLTGRYLLRRKPGTDMELEVVDRHQADAARGTASLSGGETFLASLALALALAELAGGSARIDSLFIDEGFGSLDEQSLDVAIGALEALQARGNKMIGVISHHQALTERVGARVDVVKGLGGVSRLEVVGGTGQTAEP